jgi:hypothetical protein
MTTNPHKMSLNYDKSIQCLDVYVLFRPIVTTLIPFLFQFPFFFFVSLEVRLCIISHVSIASLSHIYQYPPFPASCLLN